MRLPWPFGRRTPSDEPSPDAREGSAPAAPTVAGDTTAPSTGAWASLPPIQRTVSGAPLVAPSEPFLAAVPGHRPLPAIIQPLGHETGPSAPPGLVIAKTSAVPSLTSHGPMPGRPLQRRAAAGAALDAWSGPGPWVESAPEPAPIRHLAAVAPAATVTPSALPLTQAPSVATPVAARGTAGAARSAASAAPTASRAASSASSASSAAHGPSAAGSEPTPGSGTPASLPALRGTPPARSSRWAEHGTAATPPAPGLGAPLPSTAGATTAFRAPSAPPSSRAGSGSPAGPQGAATSTAFGPSVQRRAGLGAPMTTPPATSVRERLPVATPGRRAMPAVRSLPGADAGGTTETGHAAAWSAPVAASTAAAGPSEPRPLPVLPVSRRMGSSSTPARHAAHDHGPTAASLPGAGVEGAGPAAAMRGGTGAGPGVSRTAAPSPAAPAVRPTLGSRPLRTAAAAQREVAGSDAGPAGGPAAPGGPDGGSTPGPVAARWSPGGDLPATVEAMPAPSIAEEPVALQRLAATGAPATSSAGPASSPVREIVFPPPGVRAPAVSSAGGDAFAALPSSRRSSAVPAQPVAGRRAAAPAQPSPLALARPASQPLAPVAATPQLQRIVADPAAAAGSGPSAQASGPATPSRAPDISVTPVIQRLDGGVPTAQPGGRGGGHSDKELDELAQALFGRFRTRLRSEVIQEREARGLGFDAF